MAPKEKNFALLGAVVASEISLVKKLLKEGVDPNFTTKAGSLLDLALQGKDLKTIEALIQHKAKIKNNFVKEIFAFQHSNNLEELIRIIVKHNKEDIRLTQSIFLELVNSSSSSKKVLTLLLDHGLPVNKYIGKTQKDSCTPLHSCIMKKNSNFVSLLLERGANIFEKTKKVDSCLWLAVESDDEEIVKLLLKKGAKINEPGRNRQTVLCKAKSRKMVRILLENGANVNASDKSQNPPLKCINDPDKKSMIVKEIAKLKFDNQDVHPKNLEVVQENSYYKKIFDDCLEELEKMRTTEVHNGITFYDILKMRKQMKKITLLTKKEAFVAAFKSSTEVDNFVNYARDLRRIIAEAEDKKVAVEEEEKKMYESGLAKAFSLPPEIMDMIVGFAVDHLFVEKGWSRSEESDFDSDTDDDDEDDDDSDDYRYWMSDYDEDFDDYW